MLETIRPAFERPMKLERARLEIRWLSAPSMDGVFCYCTVVDYIREEKNQNVFDGPPLLSLDASPLSLYSDLTLERPFVRSHSIDRRRRSRDGLRLVQELSLAGHARALKKHRLRFFFFLPPPVLWHAYHRRHIEPECLSRFSRRAEFSFVGARRVVHTSTVVVLRVASL